MNLADLHALRPKIDDHTRHVIDHAIETLALLRDRRRDDPGVQLHLICSLLRETERRRSQGITHARQHGYSSPDIVEILDLR